MSSAAVGDDDDERRVRRSSSNGRGLGNAVGIGGRRVEPASTAPSAPIDVADRVDDRERGDGRVVDRADARRRRRPGPRGRGRATSRPSRRARADPADASGSSRPRPRPRPRSRRRARRRAARLDEVEDRRGRHDRHRSARGREALAALGEVAHHAVGGREPERGAAGEHDRVDLCRRCASGRAARSRASPARRRALRRADRAGREQHDGHAGARPRSSARRARRHRELAHGRELRRVADGAAAPTSRAKSTISSSSTSRAFEHQHVAAAGHQLEARAGNQLRDLLRASPGGVSTSAVPPIDERRDPHRRAGPR